MTAICIDRPMAALRLPERPRDAEEVPPRSIVRTPQGLLAEVIAHRGGRKEGAGHKDCHERLVCRYLDARNKRFGTVTLRAELVEIIEKGKD